MGTKRTSRRNRPKKLRIAFIGVGAISGMHLGILSAMEDVEIVAAADINAAMLAGVGEKFGIPHRFTDYKEMLRKVKPDAVSVCTPNGFHAPCSIVNNPQSFFVRNLPNLTHIHWVTINVNR